MTAAAQGDVFLDVPTGSPIAPNLASDAGDVTVGGPSLTVDGGSVTAFGRVGSAGGPGR